LLLFEVPSWLPLRAVGCGAMDDVSFSLRCLRGWGVA
jgi:hypothetical protein